VPMLTIYVASWMSNRSPSRLIRKCAKRRRTASVGQQQISSPLSSSRLRQRPLPDSRACLLLLWQHAPLSPLLLAGQPLPASRPWRARLRLLRGGVLLFPYRPGHRSMPPRDRCRRVPPPQGGRLPTRESRASVSDEAIREAVAKSASLPSRKRPWDCPPHSARRGP
jgi:hypothetical protein